MKLIRILLSYGVVLLTAACAQTGLFAANIPANFDGSVAARNISYGPASEQTLDIYAPKGDGKTKRDVVVFFYGGRWETGSKDQYKFVAAALVRQGFVVVIPDYRKYPDVKFPVFAEDGAKAVAWVRDNISTYHGDPSRINLAGHSAGAHIAALIAIDPKYLKAEGKNRSTVHKFAGLAGPYDFTPDEDDLKDMFGPPARYPEMRPTNFVDGKQPPMLLLHGAEDKTVGLFNLEHLKTRVKAKGGCVETRIYPGIDHIWIVAALSWLGESKAPILEDMTRFFREEKCRK